MNILKHKKIFLTFSALLVFLSIGAAIFWGFNLSVDFKGGAVYEIEYKNTVPTISEVHEQIQGAELLRATVQKIGENGFIIKTAELSTVTKSKLDAQLTFDNKFTFEEKRVKSIGPSVSSELTKKALFAILFITIITILFIAYVFRKVSQPVSSFKFGLVAIMALLHDIIIPIGIFAFLGAFFVGYQIDVLFVTALLAILGYSVNDTIVVFDRIRENLNAEKNPGNIKGQRFEELVGKSLNQTITRSINTSVTTFIVLFLLYLIGGETTKPFALVLSIGVLAGTYSSIFLASPLLVMIEKMQRNPKKKPKENNVEVS